MSARDLTPSDFAGLEVQHDRRVSFAEQEDYQVPEEAPNNGDVLLLIAPILLTLIGAVAISIFLLRGAA